jgi:hypothetical protein
LPFTVKDIFDRNAYSHIHYDTLNAKTQYFFDRKSKKEEKSKEEEKNQKKEKSKEK